MPESQKKSVLIVEDDTLIAQMYQESLAKYPITIIHAADGFIAWQNLELQVFDLVITDLMMPNMDGIGLLENIQHSLPVKPPVIVCSSLSEKDGIANALRLGAMDYLVKPVNVLDFQRTVATILDLQLKGTPLVKYAPMTGKSVTEINAAIVLAKQSAVVRVKTEFGDGELIYEHGKLQRMRFGKRTGLEALHQLKSLPNSTITIEDIT